MPISPYRAAAGASRDLIESAAPTADARPKAMPLLGVGLVGVIVCHTVYPKGSTLPPEITDTVVDHSLRRSYRRRVRSGGSGTPMKLIRPGTDFVR
jgi:hypothetical protein